MKNTSKYFYIVSIISIIGGIICFCKYRVYRNKKLAVLLLFVIILAAGVFLVSYNRGGGAKYIAEEVENHLNMSASGDYRPEQRAAIIREWIKRPVFGAGFGAKYSYFWKGEMKNASAAESMYYLRLYQTGIVGFALFWLMAIYSLKLLKQREDAAWFCIPFEVGLVCFLVVNAFNPYLANMSVLWILYLPYVIGNNKPISDEYSRSFEM